MSGTKKKLPVRKKFRVGTLVHVPNVNVLKDSFAWWRKSQVFKVSCDQVTNQRWVWVESFSKGLNPNELRMTTPAQRKQYHKEVRAEKRNK